MFAGTGEKRISMSAGDSPELSRQRTTTLAAALADSHPAMVVPPLPGFIAGGAASSGGVGQAGAAPEAPIRVQGGIDMATLEQLLQRQNERHRQEMAMLFQSLAAAKTAEAAATGPLPSASPALKPSAASAAGVAADNRKELLKKSKIVSMKIASEGAKLNKLLHKVMLARDFCTKLEGQLTSLASGKVPPQLRPFKLPYEAEQWSERTDTEDLSMLVVPVKATETFEEVALKLHIEYLASQSALC